MDFHLDPREALNALAQWPVLWVLMGGMLAGVSATQFLKLGWLAFGDTTKITERRFALSVRTFSALTTYLFTLGLWHSQMGHGGLEEWACGVWGIGAPVVFDASRALVATRWPEFAAHWGAKETLKFKDSTG
jgi:hypothetical protein